MTSFAKDQLRSIVERVERLEEEKRATAADISEVYKEAKGNGFDVAIVRQVVKIRAMDSTQRDERDALLDLYLSALGMAGTDNGSKPTPTRTDNVVPMASAAE